MGAESRFNEPIPQGQLDKFFTFGIKPGDEFPTLEELTQHMRANAARLRPEIRARLADQEFMAGLWQQLWQRRQQRKV